MIALKKLALYLVGGWLLAHLLWGLITLVPASLFYLSAGLLAWLIYLTDRQRELAAWLAKVDPKGAERHVSKTLDQITDPAERERIRTKMEAYSKANEQERQGGE